MFVEECRQYAAKAWSAYEHHPWIEAMADGTLTVDQFVYFQVHDAPHIPELHRALAIGMAKAPVGSSWCKAAATVLDDVWVLNEIAAKEELLASLGRPQRLRYDRAAASPSRTAYGNHLIRTALEGTIGEIAAALLPCAMFATVIGRRFAKNPPPGPQAFRDWARIYVERAVNRMAEEHAAMMEREAAQCGAEGREAMRLRYLRSVQYQVGVFDAAWRMSDPWPGDTPP